MNNEQQELLYEVYGKALLELAFDWLPYTPPNPPLDTIESFINKCKTDPEFSEKWGLKIGERELNDDELNIFNLLKQTFTKKITITYNDKKIESYK